MNTILLSIFLLTSIIYRFIIIDIILSWLVVFWLKINIKFIKSITKPMYDNINKFFPTKLWMFDLTPIYILFILMIIRSIILSINPNIVNFI